MSDPDSPFLDRDPIPTERAVELLATADVEVLGRMPYSSNATFLVDLREEDAVVAQGIYKPVRGERPLWDFPGGLHARETAAFLLADHLGWGFVPPTVIRDDAPLDVGSIQLFMPSHFEEHYFTLNERPELFDTFRRLCAFDIVINNTDRKSGHCLLGTDGKIWAIDNGLAFHREFKLRTVIWEFAGDDLPPDICDALSHLFDEGLPAAVAELLDPFEADGVLARTRALLTNGRFPIDDHGHRWPWPLI